MASAQQSATEYLRNARKNLVNNLKNLPVIIENLYQQNVFNDHEVDALKAEKTEFDKVRSILDWVINKGEMASYELLRILDVTQKRTLSSNLRYWISCFPFRWEDTETSYSFGTRPCQIYQTQLKMKAKCILRNQREGFRKYLDDKAQGQFSFIPLVLETDSVMKTQFKIKLKNKKSKKLRPKKLRAYIPNDEQALSPEDLLKWQDKNILIIGKPGVGKTTVVQEMLRCWAEKDGRELDYMFYFDENVLAFSSSAANLKSVLFDVYLKPMDKDITDVFQDIEENSENVVIVFDGVIDLEENSILWKIMNHELLPDAKIVITCRSEVEDDPLFSVCPTRKVYVQGFSEESINTYYQSMLGRDPVLLDVILKNQELFSLSHVPLYAFMIVDLIKFKNDTVCSHSHTVTEMYIHIFRLAVKKHGHKKNNQIDRYLKKMKDQVHPLMENAFNATMQKCLTLPDICCDEKDICHAFLKMITTTDSPTSATTYCAFLHNTMQEFFSALWLLGHPEEIEKVLECCQTEEHKHMRHVLPFLCGLLGEHSLKFLKCLFSEDQIKKTSDWFIEKILDTFLQPQSEEFDLLYVCQCLYELQSPKACLMLLEKINHQLELEVDLDPHQCCALSYVISQSRDEEVYLNLEDCNVTDVGMNMMLNCSPNIRLKTCKEPLKQITFFLEFFHTTECRCRFFDVRERYNSEKCSALLDLYSHVKDYETRTGRNFLPALQSVFQSVPDDWIIDLSQRKSSVLLEVLKLQTEKKPVELRGCSEEETEMMSFLQCLPYISQLRLSNLNENVQSRFLLSLFIKAAEIETQTGEQMLKLLTSVCKYSSFSYGWTDSIKQSNFLLDLYSHVKNYETQTGRSFLPALQSLFMLPDVWIIDLSQRKSSVLLEVLKLQTEKKQVKLRGCSVEETEMMSFLQCLPYISQLSYETFPFDEECDEYSANDQSDFLLDLYSHVKDYETRTGRGFLPALQSVFQSPDVWIIDLSQRKSSVLLEVLKLQTKKKPVKLSGCSEQESEMMSFLQCLPYISQLSYETFPFDEECDEYSANDQSDFLLDLYSHVKNYETQTGRGFLPALQSVFQSPDVWIIDLSQRKSSVLLEVLKLQTKKKPVKLSGCSEQESEMMSFLQCLPYISQLSYETFPFDEECDEYSANDQSDFLLDLYSHVKDYETRTGRSFLPALQFSENVQNRFLLSLFIKAAEIETQTGEQMLKLLTSVCNYRSFPYRRTGIIDRSNFLLDLYSHVKNYETQTGRGFLPELQSVFQSPDVWIIDLSQRKSSVLLEVLKLQTKKKPVELKGCSEEESEMMSFLQCLPYISQLRFSSLSESIESRFLRSLFIKAAEIETQTGEQMMKLLSSVYNYRSFSYQTTDSIKQSNFLLDLYSHVKNYETQTGRGFLPELQFSNLSESIQSRFLLSLFIKAAEIETQTGEQMLKLLSSVCNYSSFFYGWTGSIGQSNFLLDLYSLVKNYETQTGRSFLPALQSVFQSPDVWIIDLSQRKSSVLLEVLKLRTKKKPVELRGCSEEESEMMSFLQCLPYISQLRFSNLSQSVQSRFLLSLFIKAAEIETQTGEQMLKLLTSVCNYSSFFYGWTGSVDQSDFLLDLYSHVKNYETQTGRSFLPALQSVFQSPDVWIIDLSQRKSSVLLEVLKLQTKKKPVELRGCSEEETEMMSFLQCLPYISQLRFCFYHDEEMQMSGIRFLLSLSAAAVRIDTVTGTRFSTMLSFVCSYKTFPFDEEFDRYSADDQSDFLLDLYSHVKNYETQTGRSFLPALQSVFQSPDVWIIDLSQRKSSVLLEVLKLQTKKKPVELRGCSEEESEMMSFLQCLPYISQLRFCFYHDEEMQMSRIRFLVSVSAAAVRIDTVTGTRFSTMLSFVCSYKTFPFDEEFDKYNADDQSDFLLDLYSHMKNYETQTGRSFLPALQSVFQSPDDWIIDLSQRKSSVLLEVLKLQTEKKPVELRGCSEEESEMMSFLRCLPYISQLRFSNLSESVVGRFLLSLFIKGAEIETQTGEQMLKLLTTVYNYSSFPYGWTDSIKQSNFLLDLYSHVKNYETQTGRSFLPALQSVFQSPDVWIIDLSQRKSSVLLEVLKLQTKKKPVELKGCSEEESEMMSFLQCLPYISQLSCSEQCLLTLVKLVQLRKNLQLVTLLLEVLGFSVSLEGRLPSKTCRLNGYMVMRIVQTLQSRRVRAPVTVNELTLDPNDKQRSERNLSRVMSSLALLLRLWSVQRLNLTEYKIQSVSISALLCHQGPVILRPSKETLQKLVECVCEAQEEELTQCFLQKVGGDLTSCSLNWEELHYFLQHKIQLIAVDFRKSNIKCSISEILPFLNRIHFKRCDKSLLLQFLAHVRPEEAESLSRALGEELDLSQTQLDPQVCRGLVLILEYSEGLTELDLSQCRLTDDSLNLLLPNLHKAQNIDFSGNGITDVGALQIYFIVTQKSNIKTVRLFNNRIEFKNLFPADPRFEIW
ncbi:hypothetical protein ROHU_004194 [Labeo rohita]|uniref:NACHT domain-containing protein n=1 Tax=Labeo rohita TaxID=84645 RepID=A0A498NR40_LABRO|nr:hypothetical protein ROHU_004194 [Labeo rohita]